MKIIHRKPSANFPQTSTWGITATKLAVVIALGLHDVVIELPQRKLTKRPPDAATPCAECGALKGHFVTCSQVF
jgi:hypothetical protein